MHLTQVHTTCSSTIYEQCIVSGLLFYRWIQHVVMRPITYQT